MQKLFKVVLFLFIFFVVPLPVLAKDYSIEAVDFEVRLNKDGSANVTEKRTYNFVGSFSWADEWIELGDYKVKDLNVTGADDFETSLNSDKAYVKWYYTALNEQKTFVVSYVIENAVTNHLDISEFYWKLIGNDWDKETKVISAKVFLPLNAPDDQIWAFGHGPLNGKVSIISNNEINFEASGLNPNKFFEVRVLFPKGNFINANKGTSNLESILKEEAEFGKKTKITNTTNLLISGLISLFFIL